MQNMDQFSHDLTLALEETSKVGKSWGVRRRTRSTGNLPCAPQPTEDSSSSPTDAQNDMQNTQNQDGLTNSMLSDSDDRHDLRLSFKSRHTGNFESDSLNENFSPARPNTRRKRKFKRMAVEYETTPSTPGGTAENATHPIFPITGTVKKRVLKHTTQDNFRANLFFCGKRKRSHRDRYYDHEHGKQHSSSVPRQRDIFAPKNCYQEHKTRTRSFSNASKTSCERILPLHKSIVSKIERISQQQHKTPDINTAFTFTLNTKAIIPATTTTITSTTVPDVVLRDRIEESQRICEPIREHNILIVGQTIPENVAIRHHLQPQKSGSFESTFGPSAPTGIPTNNSIDAKKPPTGVIEIINPTIMHRRKHKHSRMRREQIRAQLQFDDPNSMECGGLSEFLSSSSLSSSDSEAAETNESDREGDDELTDWPGNEVMINFASKNDFKRKPTKKSNLSLIKLDDYAPGGDDDTLMSGDEVISPPAGVNFPLPLLTKPIQSQPIAIVGGAGGSIASGGCGSSAADQFRFPAKQIESEMSGETSNHFLSSPSCQTGEIREIRAGCRRIREERPGFSIMTSVNERLAKFLQDPRQSQLRLPDIELNEHENLQHLANLYSLQMNVDNGCAVLTKTSNTTQSVKIDQPHFGSRFFLSDYKRRCYDGRTGNFDSYETDENYHLIRGIDHHLNLNDCEPSNSACSTTTTPKPTPTNESCGMRS